MSGEEFPVPFVGLAPACIQPGSVRFNLLADCLLPGCLLFLPVPLVPAKLLRLTDPAHASRKSGFKQGLYRNHCNSRFLERELRREQPSEELY